MPDAGLRDDLIVPVTTGSRGRRIACTSRDLRRALHDLDITPECILASEWPAGLRDLDNAGLYSWWIDSQGAADLSGGLAALVSEGRIYAGQTGATKWPSGKVGSATLRSRIGGQHLHGGVRSSTFRRTLAAALLHEMNLVISAPGRLEADSEHRLGQWMREHLTVAVHAYPDRDALASLERQVLAALNPPLNLDGMNDSTVRSALTARRAELSHRPRKTTGHQLPVSTTVHKLGR